MTDTRKLLEDAARAAGIEIVLWQHDGTPHIALPGAVSTRWNPLEDDGDALRLAVKLGFRVRVCDDLGIVFCTSDDVPTHQASEGYGSDRYAAARLAITRCAAAAAPSEQEGL